MNLKLIPPIFILFAITLLRFIYVCGFVGSNCVAEQGNLIPDSFVSEVRQKSEDQFYKLLPSPHAELLLGMVVGINNFKNVSTFNDVLKSTSTIHVAVVSGFNISIVMNFILNFFGGKFKFKSILIAETCAVIYAWVTGFNAPVIRALIMGSIFVWGKFYGRAIPALSVLVFTGIVMVFISPVSAKSLSFQLSFLATTGLIVLDDFFPRFFKNKLFFSDFAASLSAQIFVWPLISYHFGRFSILGPFINSLVLWTVPVSTVLGFLLLAVIPVGFLSLIIANIVYIPLDIFVNIVSYFSNFSLTSVNLQINLTTLLIYYACLFSLFFIVKSSVQFKSEKRLGNSVR